MSGHTSCYFCHAAIDRTQDISQDQTQAIGLPCACMLALDHWLRGHTARSCREHSWSMRTCRHPSLVYPGAVVQ